MDLSALPRDTKQIIGAFIDDRSRRMMRSTSIEWFNIIHYDQFTIYFARSSTLPEIVRTFERCTKPIGLRFEKTILPVDNHFTILASLSNLTSLEVEPTRYITVAVDPDPFTALKSLQKLIINDVNFTEHVIDHHFLNLTHVTFKGPYDSLLKRESDQQDPVGPLKLNLLSKLGNHVRNIKSLEIIDDEMGKLTFDEESVSKMTQLSKVSITTQFALFPVSKLPNLDWLTITSLEFDDFSLCTKLTRLQIQARINTNQKMHQLSALTNLKHLDLLLAIRDEEYSFLSTLTNLENLLVQSYGIQSTGQFDEFIRSTKLTKIDVHSLNNLEHLTQCIKLQEICVDSVYHQVTSVQMSTVTMLKTGDISLVNHFPNLRSLQVFLSHDYSSFKVISPLTNLESLDVMKIDNATLQLVGGLTKLKEFYAAFDNISEYDCHVLQQLTVLKALSLRSQGYAGRVQQNGLWQSIAKMTNLDHLQVFCIDNSNVDVLEDLTRLTNLAVISGGLINFDDGKLSKLTNLQVLNLSSGMSFFAPGNIIGKLMNLPYLYDSKKS